MPTVLAHPVSLGLFVAEGLEDVEHFAPVGERALLQALVLVEKGIRPEDSRRMAAINLLARVTLAFVWIYQGLGPKLLYPHTGEVEIVRAANPPLLSAEGWVGTIGVLEIVYGLVILFLVRAKWVLKLNIVVLGVLTVGAFISTPVLFIEPFNPVAINVAMIGLAGIALIAMRDLPTAKMCKRKKEPTAS